MLLEHLGLNVQYELRRKANCKHLIMKVIAGKLIVSAPLRLSQQKIDKGLSANGAWIYEQLHAGQNHVQRTRQRISLRGQVYDINYIPTMGKRLKVCIKKTHLLVEVPSGIEECQIMRAIKEFLRKEAYLYMTERFTHLEQDPEVQAIARTYLKTWRIRYMKTAFGLCYPNRGDIVLNVELVLYAPHYVDYVIFHELTHFLFPNHSCQYYEKLTELCPQATRYKKELQALHNMWGGFSYL